MLSTTAIIIIAVLAGSLLITSTVLIYKLRPGQPAQPRKCSNVDSPPPSPVRRLTVVRGQVVNTPHHQRRSRFLRWPSLQSSRRTSRASSIPSLHFDEEPKLPESAITPGDLEAGRQSIWEKPASIRIEEHQIADESRHRSRKSQPSRKRSSMNSMQHGPPTYSPRQEVKGSQEIPSLVASPVGWPLPSVEKPLPALTGEKVVELQTFHSNRKWRSRKKSIRRVSGMTKVAEESDDSQARIQEIAPSAKALGKRPRIPGVDVAVVKAASISAAPPSAYSVRPSPAPSIKSKSKSKSTSQFDLSSSEPSTESVEESRGRRSSREQQERKEISDPTSQALRTRLASDSEGRESDGIRDLPKFPMSNYSTYRERIARENSRSRSRSRSASRSSKTRSDLHRIKKHRPPPITVGPTDAPKLPSVVRTSASSEGYSGRRQGKSATLLYSPEATVTAPMLERANDSPQSPESPQPFISATIVNVVSSPTYQPRSGGRRQSLNTVASSDYSPTFSLANVQRVPLYAGRMRPRIGNIQEKKSAESIGRGNEQAAGQAKVVIPSVLQTLVPSGASPNWPPRPMRRQSIQAQDYGKILHPTEAKSPPPIPKPVENAAADYEKIVNATLITSNPFVNPESPPVSATFPITRAPTRKPVPRERIISIPTGRRRSSRYSHLFEKTLPPPPPEAVIPTSAPHSASAVSSPGASFHTPPEQGPRSPSFEKPRRVPSTHASLPYPRDSLLWNAPELPDFVSPANTPDKTRSRVILVDTEASHEAAAVSASRRESDVSPLSDEFPARVKLRITEAE